MPVIVVGTEKNFAALRPRLFSGSVSTAWNRASPGPAENKPIWVTSRASTNAPNHPPCPASTTQSAAGGCGLRVASRTATRQRLRRRLLSIDEYIPFETPVRIVFRHSYGQRTFRKRCVCPGERCNKER